MSDLSSMGRYGIDQLVEEYQKTKSETLLRTILDHMTPILKRRCKTEDELQIARIIIWEAASTMKDCGNFVGYVQSAVRKQLTHVRFSGGVVRMKQPYEEYKKAKAVQQAWREYTQHGGDAPCNQPSLSARDLYGDQHNSNGHTLWDIGVHAYRPSVEDQIAIRQVLSRMKPNNADALVRLACGDVMHESPVSKSGLLKRRKKAKEEIRKQLALTVRRNLR